MAYAAPAGGILCLELLKPTLHTGLQTNPEITRSITIQILSLLVGFLDWIQLFAPNGDFRAECRVIVRHVLEYSLNTVPVRGEIPITFEWDLDPTQLDLNFDSRTRLTGCARGPIRLMRSWPGCYGIP